MSWRTVAFGSVCHLVNGKAFKPSDWSASGIPIIRIQNLNGPDKPFNHWAGGLHGQVAVKKDDLLLAWSGTPGTSFGAHIWRGGDCVLNQHIFRCDLDFSRVTREWAKFALNSRLNRLIDLAHGGVGLKHVTKGVVENLEVPIPPLPEQRRIAAILDQAESLRAKRRQTLNRLDAFPQSLFFDLFGDPVANSKGWKRVPVAEIVTSIESGWSPICLDRPARGDEWGVLKLGAVTWCEYAPDQNKALPLDLEPDPKLEVRPGDLLFTRKNTYELVGACAIVRHTPPHLMLPDLVFRLCLRPDAGVDPDYLHRLLINPRKRREIQKLAGGSAGSMPNISKGRLLGAEIEVPPPPLQRAFAAQVAAVERLKSSHRASLAKLNALFASLQHRAFRGEL